MTVLTVELTDFSLLLSLKGRPLREQQEVAAAVIQRCYRKYKQVTSAVSRELHLAQATLSTKDPGVHLG